MRKAAILARRAVAERTISTQKAVVKRTVLIRRAVIKRTVSSPFYTEGGRGEHGGGLYGFYKKGGSGEDDKGR